MTRGKRTARQQTVKRGKSASPRKAVRRKTGPGIGQRLLAAQPLPPAAIRRIAITAIVGITALVGWQLGSVSGVNAYVQAEAVEAVGRAGFSVKRLQVEGANRIDNMRIYDIALDNMNLSMAAFDVDDVRADLLQYGWVADARVSRRLPDTLVIELVERTPVAVLQRRGQYTLIDAQGQLLPGVDAASVPGLPVIVGDNAAQQMPGLQRLLAAAPALQPRISGASWMGHRRWDLHFNTGETLSLPDNAAAAEAAFAEFARLDGVNRLLGRRIKRVDMRTAGQLVLRPGREGDLGDLGLIVGGDRTVERAAPDAPGTGG